MLWYTQSNISLMILQMIPLYSAQGNKKNREAILRKRAKQREAYLKELESKGLYDPNKTPQTKPDPERWIPKSQRSYNRRGRRGRYNSNIGAQGGGAGAGMERDAQKLDVAARVAAAKSGAASGTGKLSTANMQVSGSGPARKGKGKRR
jgi:signal recognition particle subunit SRP72